MRSSDRLSRWALPILLMTGGPAAAITQVPGPIEIGPSWGKVEGNGRIDLYTRIANQGVLADRLVGGSCSGFGSTSLAGLNPQTQANQPDEKGVFIPPGRTVTLTPDGPYLAVTDAQDPVKDGALVPCTLDFVHSGQRIVIFRIGPPEPAVDEP